jgi:GDPmannose 4,6-dehydratase
MKKLVAIIVGGTGQLGIITSNLLLKQNYKVIITSRSIAKIGKIKKHKNLVCIKLNIYNTIAITKLLKKFKPNLIFYYAGQSSPSKSFYQKTETYKSNYLGCKNFLDIIRKNEINCKFINASSCEIYGNLKNRINISSSKKPVNPYGFAKLKSFEITKKFRNNYNIKSYNAVIFNTESFFRKKNFLIPKICLAAISAKNEKKKTRFGNLKISREWNWGPEQITYLLRFIKKKPQDFLLSNGKSYSAIDMLKFAFQYFNLDYKKYILKNDKLLLRQKDILSKKSNWKSCLKRNKIEREIKIYGKKLIISLIKHYQKKL